MYLEGGRGVPGEEGLLLILHNLSNDLLLLQPYPGLLPRAHLPQQDSKGVHICSLRQKCTQAFADMNIYMYEHLHT